MVTITGITIGATLYYTVQGLAKVKKVQVKKAWKAFCEFNQGLAQGAGYALRH